MELTESPGKPSGSPLSCGWPAAGVDWGGATATTAPPKPDRNLLPYRISMASPKLKNL